MANAMIVACTFSLMIALMLPSTASCHYSSGVEQVGERTSSFLASPFVAAFDPAPLVPRLQAGPFMPEVPPGMCRWERTVLDSNGRPVLDRYGRPLTEYTIGSCLYPPN